MSESQYIEDKVYLRDKRNGNIYIYERNLAKLNDFEPYVPNPSEKQEQEVTTS